MGLSQGTRGRPMAYQDPLRLEKGVSPSVRRKSQTNISRHYLLRHEIISVHGTEGLPQIYPVCIQINLSGSGTTVPKDTYKFPDIYNNFDTTFKAFQTKHDWDEFKPAPDHEFVAPGPPLYDGSGGGNSKSKRTGTGAPLKTGPGVGAAIDGKAADTYTLASTSAGAATSSVSSSILPAAALTSTQGGPADSLSSPPVGGPSGYAGPSPAAGADAANPAPSFNVNLSNKGVVNDTAAGDAIPDSSDGLEGAHADANTTASPSANAGVSSAPDPSATAIAAGANAAASSVVSSPATAPAVTGTSEYASNIQGGDCLTEHWRCQKKADGTMFLQVCKNKADGSLGYGQYSASVHSIV